MSQCRMCQKDCQSNSLLNDRFFREKFQDIICMWVEAETDPTQCDVCQVCAKDILEFYSYKQRCRQILRGIKNPLPLPCKENTKPSSKAILTEPDMVSSLLDNCDETVEISAETLKQLSSGVLKRVTTKRKKRSVPGISGTTRKPYVYRTPEQRLAEKMRPKRAIRRKTEAEKAMDPAEYKKEYFKKAMEKYKQTCELCGKRISKNLMEGHMNNHKGVTPFSCEFCGQGFACKHNLRNHINRSHVVGKEVSCPECGKVSTCAATLKSHMRAVHSDRKYQCSLCGLRILDKHSLQRHMNIHTQTRDFVCPHCGKAFYCNSVLKIHLRTHSGETPYICNICPKGFIHRRIYVMHMQKLHPAEPLMKLDAVKALKETLMKKY